MHNELRLATEMQFLQLCKYRSPTVGCIHSNCYITQQITSPEDISVLLKQISDWNWSGPLCPMIVSLCLALAWQYVTETFNKCVLLRLLFFLWRQLLWQQKSGNETDRRSRIDYRQKIYTTYYAKSLKSSTMDGRSRHWNIVTKLIVPVINKRRLQRSNKRWQVCSAN